MAYGRIGVIGAMDSELAALIAALTQPAQETVQGLVFRTGRLGAREVVLVRCGIENSEKQTGNFDRLLL